MDIWRCDEEVAEQLVLDIKEILERLPPETTPITMLAGLAPNLASLFEGLPVKEREPFFDRLVTSLIGCGALVFEEDEKDLPN